MPDRNARDAPSPARAGLAALAIGWRAAGPAWLAALGLGALIGLVSPASGWLGRLLIDSLTSPHVSAARVVTLATLATGIGAASMVVGNLSTVSGAAAQRRITLEITERLYQAVNRVSGLSRFEDPAYQDQLKLAEQAAGEAPVALSSMAQIVLRGVATIAGFAGALILVWPPMAAILVASVVPSLVSQLLMSRRQAEAAEAAVSGHRRRAAFGLLLTDARTAQEIRLFGLGELFGRWLTGALRAATGAEYAVTRRVALREIRLAALGSVVVALGAGEVAYQAARGRVTVADFVLFLASVSGVQAVLGSLVDQLAELGKSMRLFRHFLELLDAPDDLPAGTLAARPLRHGIELRDVWFRYHPAGEFVLRGVSLRIPAGRSVGLVGRNGEGKSTLIKLLCRCYDPERGQILWDGEDIRGLDVRTLRRRLAVTVQDYTIYDLTASENIGIGLPGRLSDRDRIIQAAGLAGVDQTIAALPRGYDTLLSRSFSDGEEPGPGVRLSGGQGQRLALARALMRDDVDLMILDEPSSGLDAEAESEIHRSLRAHRRGRTCLLVSHRLSAVRAADEIVVLAGGQIRERGTHDQLMAAGGQYASLFALQASGYQDKRVAAAAS